jgi:hypothetical protein
MGQTRPDVRVETADLGTELVKVAVTYFVDDEKLALIVRNASARSKSAPKHPLASRYRELLRNTPSVSSEAGNCKNLPALVKYKCSGPAAPGRIRPNLCLADVDNPRRLYDALRLARDLLVNTSDFR